MYYTQTHEIATLKNESGVDPFLESLHANYKLDHIQHCIDYLRQALMCAADTNLEDRNVTTGKTNGWGFARKCRNYWGVVAWAEQWRNNEDTTLFGEVEHHM